MAVVVAAAVAGLLYFRMGGKKGSEAFWREVRPETGSIRVVVSTTATILPQNRLEIKSSVGGRIDEILVKEGESVKKGQVLALVSSTERAALLDAATLKGKGEIEYWKNVYKQTALIAPIDGEVIVSSIDPGQTITTSDVVLVLSDRLIVKADVDETDIGRVKVGQSADIRLDAYPDIRVRGVVDHVYYESKLVNNVNIYKVDLVPSSIPDVFRSGMSANVDVIVEKKDNVLLLPLSAVRTRNGSAVVSLRDPKSGEVTKVGVKTGSKDARNVEIVSGIAMGDAVVVRDSAYVLPKNSSGSNPFVPQRKNPQQNRP